MQYTEHVYKNACCYSWVRISNRNMCYEKYFVLQQSTSNNNHIFVYREVNTRKHRNVQLLGYVRHTQCGILEQWANS